MEKLQIILNLVAEYIKEKHSSKTWTPGKDWVQYSGPYFSSEEYISAINTLLNEWLILGKDADQFEQKFPSLLGKKYGIVTNSGSSSNLLMWATILSKHNNVTDEKISVIIPVAGFPTTLNPIIQLGCNPIFVDIELHTLNLDLDQVEDAAKRGAQYITFAHVLGNPPNMNRVMEIVNKYNLTLLEDCCDALGSTYDNKPLGSFGRLASCSFYPAHHMTMGEGGFVACDTKEDEKILRSLRDWGRGCYCSGKTASLSVIGTCGNRFNNWLSSLPNEIFDHKYIYNEIGYNLKPIELQCSMGLVQMKKLPEIHYRRKENYTRLLHIFSKYEEFFHIHWHTEKSDPSWFAFPITLKNNIPFKRFNFTTYLENAKIQTRTYFGGNLLLQPAYEHLLTKEERLKYPIATKVTTDTLFLGTSPVITKEQLDYVEKVVEDFLKHYE